MQTFDINQLDISRTLNVEKSYVIFSESNDNMTSCNCSCVIFTKWGLWCAISIFRSSGAVILNSAEKFFCPGHVRRTCCFKAHLKTFHSSRLTQPSKAEAYEESTLQEIHNDKKTTGLLTEMILKSTTVSDVQKRITKHMLFYDDRQCKARDICFFDFNWSRKLAFTK